MAEVQHGRRKGQPRSAPDSQRQIDVNEMPLQQDIRKVTILSKNDWNRIHYQLNRKQIEAEKLRQKKAEEEAKINSCKEIVKNWTNTLAGQRQKKLEARKLRLEKEEEEKKAIDIEEAKYQAQKRKEAIEKAKTQQYYQSDRVKQFHGALLLTEVLKEREAQLELARLKEKAYEGKDREWVELQQREFEEAIRQDQLEAAKRNKERQDAALFQMAQIKAHIKQNDEDQKNDRVEGEELQRLAVQHQMEKSRLEAIRRDERRQLMSDNVKQIADVGRMKDIQKLQEEEEDEECNIFARAKRKMMKLRAEKERQLHNEKQERLERIRNKLRAQMKEKLDDEDERILRAVEESEAKRGREEAENQAKHDKMRSSITKHRHEQMKEQEEEAAANRMKDLEMLAVRKEADRIFRANEEEKRKRRIENDRKLMGYHFKQIDEVKDKVQKTREEELAQAQVNMGLIELEERQFQEYAGKVIDHCEKGGRNTYALKKAAREGAGGGLGPILTGKGGIRPSYMVQDKSGVQMPHYQRDTTEETKKNIYGDGQTNKRLGFVW